MATNIITTQATSMSLFLSKYFFLKYDKPKSFFILSIKRNTKENGHSTCYRQCHGLQNDLRDRPGSYKEVLKTGFGNWPPMNANGENNI